MSIRDIDPGYLDRQGLLAEHRELHGIVTVLARGNKGYAGRPEISRWSGYGWALRQRHRLLVCEMNLRGYRDHSPDLTRSAAGMWPDSFIASPAEQFRRLDSQYAGGAAGRIPLPTSVQQLWSQHKYSLLARSPILYSALGREIAANARGFDALAMLLVTQMRQAPSPGGIRNALQHMWGYVNDCPSQPESDLSAWSTTRLLREVQRRAIAGQVNYLLASTALAELMAWL